MKLIGEGSYGKVYKVSLKKDPSQVFALKAIKKSRLKARSIKRAISERDIMVRSTHPFIVTIKAAFQDPQYLFYLMDYMERGDLFCNLQGKNSIRENDIKFYISCVVLALEFLHENKIVYRDLKLENLLVDEMGYI